MLSGHFILLRMYQLPFTVARTMKTGVTTAISTLLVSPLTLPDPTILGMLFIN